LAKFDVIRQKAVLGAFRFISILLPLRVYDYIAPLLSLTDLAFTVSDLVVMTNVDQILDAQSSFPEAQIIMSIFEHCGYIYRDLLCVFPDVFTLDYVLAVVP
jgi:hypothetical protein